MDFAVPRVFMIKDLKALENGLTRVSIDIKVLKDLKRPLLMMETAGDRPPRYGEKRLSFLFRSFRSCMSIAREAAKSPKVL